MTIKNCKQCKKEFKRWGKPRGGSVMNFCGKKCYWDSMREEKPISVCSTCGIEFKSTSHVKTLKYCSMKCRSESKDWRKQNSEWHKKLPKSRFSAMGLKSVSSQDRIDHPTSIEKAVYDYLVIKGIVFEKQKLINGKFSVDAYIPSLNLVIECDGSYWHSLDKNMKRDKAKNAYLAKCGYGMVRLNEPDIRNNKFVQILERRLI